MLSRFHTIPESNGQTDRQTDTQNFYIKQASKHIYLSNDRLPKKPLAQQTVKNQLTQRTKNLHPGHSTQT